MTGSSEVVAQEMSAEDDQRQPVRPITVFRYLAGQRSAILNIAASPQMLAVGGVLVLSAGFAREYDGEDLLHEPWHLLIPHGASLLTSFLLYLLLRLTGIGKTQQRPAFFRGFPMFLRLYWMTAPLAWLYAIPFERWMSPAEATLWNLRLLGIVSVWRVALMIRVIRVVYGAGPLWRVISTVLLFGDAVMLMAIRFVPVPIFNVMGGVRMSESEHLVLGTTLLLQFIGYPLLFILLIMTLVHTATPWTSIMFSKINSVRASTWMMAAVSLLIWPFILPLTQPEQQRRRTAERLIMARDFSGAFEFMSSHNQSDFPPHWSPPPHVARYNPVPPINDLIEVMLDDSPAEWVKAVFLEKFRNTMERTLTRYGFVTDEQLSSSLRIIDRLPISDWLPTDEWRRAEAAAFLRELSTSANRTLSQADKDCLQRIIDRLPPLEQSRGEQVNPPADRPADAASVDEANVE